MRTIVIGAGVIAGLLCGCAGETAEAPAVTCGADPDGDGTVYSSNCPAGQHAACPDRTLLYCADDGAGRCAEWTDQGPAPDDVNGVPGLRDIGPVYSCVPDSP